MKYRIVNPVVLIFVAFVLGVACSEKDETPPIIRLNGNENVRTPLNEPWNDPGVKATDDFDGDISSKVFVDNPLDINMVGLYEVVYSVVDQAGNMASPVSRFVEVFNSAESLAGIYDATDRSIFPETDTSYYSSTIVIDSSVNQRLRFFGFSHANDYPVYGDVADTVIVVPYQEVGEEQTAFSVQGAGAVTDTLIRLNVTRFIDEVSHLSEIWFRKK